MVRGGWPAILVPFSRCGGDTEVALSDGGEAGWLGGWAMRHSGVLCVSGWLS